MSVSARSVASALRDIVGRDHVVDDPGARERSAIDGVVPRWVVTPTSFVEVARLLALAHEERLAVVPRGSGSALGLGRPPARVDLMIETTGLARILDYSPDDLTVSVEAGVTAGALGAVLDGRRQFLPVDPAGWAGRTVGGIAATGASGPLRARYGTIRDLLLGVRFVQADGVLSWGGARVVKSVTGYDVPKLMVGSLGSLGLLVELTLRLHPRPEFEASWFAIFASPTAAQAFTALVLDSALEPNRLEMVNGVMLEALAGPAAGAAVVVAIGSVEAAVRAQGEQLADLARRAGGALSSADDAVWARYGSRSLAAPGSVRLRVVTLASRLGEMVAEAERATRAIVPDAVVLIRGCAAAGTAAIDLVGAPPAGAARLVEHLRGVVAGAGGSVVIEHGPRDLRLECDPWGPIDPERLRLMRRLKDTFDPERVLNPGRFAGGL